ncbi:alpha/beta fold hydrolase [Microvirga arabica]|uniref:alpha/beta fold hydrolase n=1 Tax=Microvirga arabica TaxID=1128671 RepID=UPI00193A5F25|nr:alpha/beta hydrolase [Microvirga arabica]MBM1169437.1 alpha/beta hydrolase [Microvirga arabica]
MTAASELPTILLLPGLLCDASVWKAQIEALRPHAHVLVADFSQHDSLEAMARSALAMVECPIIAIGHSMGARVAMEMAHLAPGRIRKLALIDTGIDSRKEGEEAKRQVLVDLAYAEGMGALADRWLPPMVHMDRVEDVALLAPLKEMVMRATPEQHQRQIRALLNRPNLVPRLADITCPTLVMVGRQDRWSPLAQHEEMAARIPNAELVVIEDSGHMTLLEQPEQVSNALLHWLGFENKLAGTHAAAGMGS